MLRTFLSCALMTLLAAGPASGAKPASKAPAGGAYQKASVEGCIGQTLFDGLWRVKVTGVESAVRPFSGTPGTPGYAVALQFRNGSNRTASLANTGFDGNGHGIELVTADGNELDLDVGDFQKTVFRAIPQGGSYTTQLHYYFPSGTSDNGSLSKADKLLLQIDPHAGGLRDVGLRYPIADPSFRIRLSCDK